MEYILCDILRTREYWITTFKGSLGSFGLLSGSLLSPSQDAYHPPIPRVSPNLQGSKTVYWKSLFLLTRCQTQAAEHKSLYEENRGLKNKFMKYLENNNKGFDE